MLSIRGNIVGIPYPQDYVGKNKAAPIAWSDAIVDQTSHLPLVDHPCLLRVTFLLPPNKFPRDLPYGGDIDNLLKRFCDALEKTVFRNAPGGDAIILSLEATKTRVETNAEAGAVFEIITWPLVRE